MQAAKTRRGSLPEKETLVYLYNPAYKQPDLYSARKAIVGEYCLQGHNRMGVVGGVKLYRGKLLLNIQVTLRGW